MAAAVAMTASCGTANAGKSADGTVTLEFAQWWEPELPKGSLRTLMDTFEAKNPGIKVKLLSGPYASTKEQVIAGAAAGTMSDVVGLDGAWINDFSKQGSLADLSALMKESKYDQSQLASQVKIDGTTLMIPAVNFVYPMFTNDDLLAKAGVSKPPSTRSEFTAAAVAISKVDSNVKGWVLPLSQEAPNGIQNDVMSWVWASGGSMLKDGKPDLTNDAVHSAVNFVQDLWDKKVVSPGALTMKEQDKVEEFTNARVGMMIDSLAHIKLIRENNPKLKFSISAVPAVDGFTGKRGIPYAAWGIGIADNSPNKAEAWKLVDFLMSEETNAKLSSLSNSFPGNTKAVPDFVDSDALFKKAFEIYKGGYPANEFVGLPVAEQLMRSFDEELQKTLSGQQNVDKLLANAQATWMKSF
ncbi:ABC transporter substrate-binding protein [Arthrobacter wenxiniae]|nr:sugar ABC transporter substrate-binding protein [Arthrobacter wenxiniae]